MGNRTKPQTARSGLYDDKFMPRNLYTRSFWYAKGLKNALNIAQDYLINNIIYQYIKNDPELRFSIEKINISRTSVKEKKSDSDSYSDNITVSVFCSKPGRFCRFEGIKVNEEGVKEAILSSVPNCGKLTTLIKKELIKSNLATNVNLDIQVTDVSRAQLSAELIAGNIASYLSEKKSYELSKYIRDVINTINAYKYGIRIQVSGRINGASIARQDVYGNGKVRLSSLSRNIVYSCISVGDKFTSGTLGVKVWVDKGGSRRG